MLRLSVDIAELKEVQKQQAANLESQSANIDRLTADIDGLRDSVAAMRDEMREGFNNLIIANEVTRDLAERVGKLALATSQRVTNLEQSE
jgi:methyl-accepting chemotaxis protein